MQTAVPASSLATPTLSATAPSAAGQTCLPAGESDFQSPVTDASEWAGGRRFRGAALSREPADSNARPALQVAFRALLAVLLLFGGLATAGAGILAGPITNAANGHLYYLLTTNTWTASQAEARALGGDLVTINDQAEQDWVYATFHSFGGTNRILWLGLNDAQVEGAFTWVSGDPAAYRNWWVGEPNDSGGTEDYAAIYSEAWNDLPDDASNRYPGDPMPQGVVEIPLCTSPPTGLVGWWKGEGNANELIGGNHGAPQGNSVFAPGRVGQAFSFNGTNSFIVVPDSQAFNPTDRFSVETWVLISGPSTEGCDIISKDGEATNRQYLLAVGLGTHRFRANIWNSNTVTVDGTSVIQPNTWYHLGMTFDGGTLKLYVNGLLEGEQPSIGPLAVGSEPLRIGGGAPTGQLQLLLTGAVDEPSIYDRALTAGEIAAIYAAGSAGKCAGVYQPGFVWKRASDWTVRPDSDHNTTNGNPDDDAFGNPAWRYEYVTTGGALGSAQPWFTAPGTLLRWDKSWGGVGMWVVTDDVNPPISKWWLLHNRSYGQWAKVPVVRWLNPVASPVAVEVSGNLHISWSGHESVGSPDDIDVALVLESATAGTRWLIYSNTVSKPTPSDTIEESMVLPIALPRVFVEQGGRILVSLRSRTERACCAGRWNHLADYLAIKLLDQSPVPITILRQPQSTNALWSGSAAFQVSVVSLLPVSYQWRFNTAPLVNQTNSTLLLAEIQPAQAGNYDVVLRNAGGSLTSAVAVLTVVTNIPDLQPVGLMAPLAAQELQSLTVSWVTTNAGNAAATAPWRETVSVANNPAGTNATLLATLTATNSLEVGASVLRAQGVVIPVGLSGTYWLVVRTDSDNQVAEGYGETNNLTVRPISLQLAGCVPPPAGLVAWWPADGNAADVAGSSGTALLANGASFVPGAVGLGFGFDGVDDHAEIPDSPALHSDRQLTLSFWFKVNSLAPEWQTLLWKGDRGDCTIGCENREYALFLNRAGSLHFVSPPLDRVGTGQLALSTTNSLVLAGQWHHLAAVLDCDANRMLIFLNGANVAGGTYSTAGIRHSVGPLLLGTVDNGGYPFGGGLDELSLYHRALSPTEIAAIYAAGSAGKCGKEGPVQLITQPQSQTNFLWSSPVFVSGAVGSAPVSFQWLFNGTNLPGATNSFLTILGAGTNDAGSYQVVAANASGSVTSAPATLTLLERGCAPPPPGLAAFWPADGNALDYQGGNHASLRNGASITNAGLSGQCFTFDGVDDYLQVADSGALRPSMITLAGWIRADSLATTAPAGWGNPLRYIAFKQNGGSSGPWEAYLLYQTRSDLSGDRFGFTISSTAGTQVSIYSTTTIVLGQFYHVAITYDGGTMRLYVNGRLEGSTWAGFPLSHRTNPLFIGWDGQHENLLQFHGAIDELALYNRALTAGEIAELHASSAGQCKSMRFRSPVTLGTTDTTYDGLNVIVDGTTLTISGAHTFASLVVTNGGIVTHPYGDLGGVRINTAGDFVVAPGSSVNVAARGYAGSSGPGAGPGGNHGAGGGYGGAGGNSYGRGGGWTYGSITQPTDSGSGGGDNGGWGGGSIHLVAQGQIKLDGALLASGGDSWDAGGGAGGSIWVECANLSGAGLIAADGGNVTGSPDWDGGGGGGRIAVYYSQSTYTGSFQAFGGNGRQYGGAGTVYLQPLAELGTLIVENNRSPNTKWCAYTDLRGPDLSRNVNLAAHLLVKANGIVSHPAGYGLTLNLAGDLTVLPGGTIYADGRGHPGSSGPGAGGGGNHGAGGGHGGTGGNSYGRGGGWTYGSITQPTDFGSGGGDNGGWGGGFFHIIVQGRAHVDGHIGVPGADSWDAGGGAGGSIWLECDEFSGGGMLSANGGNVAGSPDWDGGGGGGRIAVHYNQSTYAGSFQAFGGNGRQCGGAGTVYLQPRSGLGTLIVENNQSPSAKWCAYTDLRGDDLSGNVQLAANLLVKPNGVVSHPPGYALTLGLAGDITVQSGGFIWADGRGYPGSSGPGAGGSGDHGAGGGHGGTGGNSYGRGGGWTYGSITEPSYFGSGGGDNGGWGGGFIHIIAQGDAQIDGAVGAPGADSWDAGGGAGGSVWLECADFSGSGVFVVNGGSVTGSTDWDGGGGGGRIAVHYNQSAYAGSFQAFGGNGRQYGGAGTVYLQPRGQFGTLIIENNRSWADKWVAYTDLSGNIDLNANLVVKAKGVLSHPPGYPLTLRLAGDVNIQPGGFIWADGRGYAGGNGPGAGGSGDHGAGGGHGGTGGNSYGRGGGWTYGSITEPVHFGSGGGDGGGYGGGALHLIAAGNAQVDGGVGTSGADSWDRGAGAGGSIWLECAGLSGAGVIAANGGNVTGSPDWDGGGGGGRIAVYYNQSTYSGSFQAFGGNGRQYGGAGTVYLQPRGHLGTLIVENSQTSATKWTAFTDLSGDIALAANLLVKRYGVLSHPPGYALALRLDGDATIESGGSLYVGGRGYPGSTGPGAGGGGDHGAGGGHGGRGGNSVGRAGGGTYGSVSEPTSFGSGGGDNGGYGGGALRLVVQEGLRVDGYLGADGADSWDRGAGAGGSLWLECGGLTGTGAIGANGGNVTGTPCCDGGGGGGRVAIYSPDQSGFSAIYVNGGSGYQYGEPGTIYRGQISSASLVLKLQAGSDSGPSNTDRITAVTTPTFDATVFLVNTIWAQATNATLALDFNADGTADVTQVLSSNGIFAATAPLPLPEGTNRIIATLDIPGFGALSATNTITVMTHGPRVIAATPSGAVTNELAQVDLTLAGVLHTPSLAASNVVLTGPEGGIPVNAPQLLSGATWRISFPPQRLEGGYTLTVTTNVMDVAGNRFNQDDDGTNGEPEDAFALTLNLDDQFLPYVIAFVPQGPTNQDVSLLRATFNEPMNPSTFSSADVVLTGPAGLVDSSGFVVTPVADSTNRVFEVQIPTQTADGEYSVAIGPSIEDLAGNTMSGNSASIRPIPGTGIYQLVPFGDFEDGFGGVWTDQITLNRGLFRPTASTAWRGQYAVEAQPTESFTGGGFAIRQTRPVLPGGRYVLSAFANTSGLTSGDLHLDLNDVTWNAGNDVDAPAFIAVPGWQFISTEFTVPSGVSTVTVRVVRDADVLVNERGQVDDVALTPVGSFVPPQFYGQNFFSFTIDKTGPRIVAALPEGPVTNELSQIEVAFDTSITGASFGASDVAIAGPSGAIAASTVNLVSSNRYRVTFPAQRRQGAYTFTVGPDIGDPLGNLMDQNENGTNGEPADAFVHAIYLRDETPAEIVTLDPVGVTNGTVSLLRVRFNEPMDTNTFSAADVSVAGPLGALDPGLFIVRPIPGNGITEFEVELPPLADDGAYTVRIGPDIRDEAGNPLRDAQVKSSYLVSFEFGTGPEWSVPWLSWINTTPATRVLGNFTTHTSTLVLSGLPPHQSLRFRWDQYTFDTWDADGDHCCGPDRVNLRLDEQVVFTETFDWKRWPVYSTGNWGANANDLDRLIPDVALEFPHTNNSATIQFFGDGGGLQGLNDESWGLDNLCVSTFGTNGGVFESQFIVDRSGPRILAMSPSGVFTTAVSSVVMTFSEPVDVTSLTTADVQVSGPGAPGVSGVTHLGGTQFRVDFAAPLGQADYVISVGPGIGDLAGNLMDQDGDRQNGESGEDVFRGSLRVNLPDLVVTSISVPETVVANQPLAISWSVTNRGVGFAPGGWSCRLAVATNAAGAGQVVLGDFVVPNALAGDSAVISPSLVIVPPALAGPRWFTVTLDPASAVLESDEGNNFAVATNVAVVQAADLAARVLASAPSAVLGQSNSVTWAVDNTGDAPASATWADRIYLATNTTSFVGATLLTAVPGTSPVAPGTGYTNTASFTLPGPGQLPPGSYFLIVAADGNGGQPEANEANNLASAPLTLTLPPLPDLAVGECVPPASVSPGESFTVVWSILNLGNATASGLWREVLSYSNSASGVAVAAYFDVTNGLAASGVLWRTQAVSLPISGPAGEVHWFAQVDAGSEVFEADESNNVAWATNVTQVPATLTLSVPASLAEGASAQASITRNGSRAAALTVWVTNSDPTEISLHASASLAGTNVVIPAGAASASFLVRAVADGVYDGPQIVGLVAAATNFASATTTVTVQDVDLPRLTLVLSTNAVWEGSTLTAVVSREIVSTNPLAVVVQSSSPGQFSPPTYVTIPGGAAATNFSLLAVDDNLVEGMVEYSLAVSAGGFAGAEATAFVLDNDLPTVTLALASSVVSEGAGPQATVATVTRSILSARALAVDLESTNATAALVPARVVIPGNQFSVSFPVAAVNDHLVDGPQTTYFRPFVVASQGGLRLLEGTGALLTVTDDDGPTLTLLAAKKVVAEGLNPATTLTVLRNTPGTNALTVTLASSDTTEATMPASVVIPTGTNAAVVPLVSVGDGVTDGNQTVVITASAPGFVSGTETVVVSDADLPDLVVNHLTAPATADTDSYVSIGYRVVNQGLGPAGTNFTVRVFLSRDQFVGDDILVAQAPFSGVIPVGQFFEQTLQVRLPLAAGTYWVVAQVDADQAINEILEDNNATISTTSINSRAAYGAWVETSLTTALAGTPVPMSGRATNSAGAGVDSKLVNLHIQVRGTERVISALTDASGNFATTWQPLPGEAGLYQIFATHPGVSSVPVQDTFRLVGMRADPASVAVRAVEAAAKSGSVQIENLSDLPLTGLAVAVLSQPAGLNVSANLPGGATLAGGAQAALNYTVLAPTPQAFGNVVLRVSSAEGAAMDATLAVSVEPLRPRLVATPGNLVAGMARGHQAVGEFQLRNDGGVATGPITVALPATPWLSLASTNPMPPLIPGETNAVTVTLLLTPAADLLLGAYTGSLALNSSNASLSVPFNFRALSEARGDLLITAVDELTYYADGSPNLAGARVTVRDAVSGANVATGLTGTNGQFFAAQLPEAYYEIELTADRHTTYRGTHLLVAGQTNRVEAFLSLQTVTYTWTVEPIQIEDRYNITVQTTFEANVPLPVVTIEPSVIDLSQITAAETQVMLVITNHGLIAANEMTLTFPTHPLWRFEPLLTEIGTLPARMGVVIPVAIRRVLQFGGRDPKDGDLGPCQATAFVCWGLVCGGTTNRYCARTVVVNARQGCGSEVRPTPDPIPPHITDPWIGDGPHPPPIVVNPIAVSPPTVCGCGYLPKLCLSGDKEKEFKGLAARVTQAILRRIPVARVTDSEFKITLSGEACSCCASNHLSGEASAMLRGEMKVGVDVGPGFAEGIPFPDFGPWKDISVDGRALLGVRAEITASLEGGYEKKCGEEGAFCVRGEAALRLFTGAEFEGNATAKFRIEDGLEVRFFDFSGHVSGTAGLEGNLTARFEWCNSVGASNTITLCGNLFSRLNVHGQLVGTVGSETWTNGFTRSADVLLIGSDCAPPQGGRQPKDDPKPIIEDLPPDLIPSLDDLALRRLVIDPSLGEGICAQVKLATDQQAVLSRDAFRATIEINNQDINRLESLEVRLTVTDEAGVDRTSLFGVHSPELVGISSVEGNGILPSGGSGSAKWTIVPTTDAAPTNSKAYYISGRLTYTQGGLGVSVPLAPVAITVLPTPRLYVHYFHERDVFSDDPFTDILEPSIPFNLAILVQNRGFGAARNFRITSAQPEIRENEKGLLVDFQIIATEVAGQNMVPSLTANFGNINPGQTAIGRWLLTSSLQGLFTDYSATFQHIDALDGVKLSLLEDVQIHEMIHLVRAGGTFEDGKPDFLVNDIPDLHDLPDTLWLSDGTTNPVQVVQQATHNGPPVPGQLQVQLSAPMPAGWAYLRVPEPANGAYRLVGVRRSDGGVIGVGTNAWVTDRTFIGLGRQPVRENTLHLLDYNSTGTYTLTYEALPAMDVTAPVSQVAALPSGSYRHIPVSWSGQDESGGSGIAGYDVFVSESGGAFTRWLERTTLNSSLYFGTLGSSYAFYSVAIDRAGNREAAPGAPDATTTVTLTNHAPVFAPVAEQAIDEGTEFVLAVPASDPDPADVLTYSLASAPSGMTISPATSLIRWLTTEATGPSTNVIAVRALDNGDPPLAATNTFTLLVREVNQPPTLAVITNRTINEGQLLTITNTATDNDLPPNKLTFSLHAPFPAGAAVNPTNGIFSWRPTETQGPSTNHLAVVVTDNGSPSLSATQQFLVVVRDTMSDIGLSLGRTNLLAGESGTLPLTLRSSLDLTNLTFWLDAAPSRLANQNFRGLAPEVTGVSMVSTGGSLSRLSLTLDPALASASVRDVATLDFLAVPNLHSAIVTLDARDLLAWRAGGAAVTNGTTSDGRVIIVDREPVLESVLAPQPRLLLYGRPGAGYALQFRTNLLGAAPWTEWRRFTLLDRVAGFDYPPVSGLGSFWRAFEFRAEPPRLISIRQAGPWIGLWLEGWPGSAYGIETTPALGMPWQVWTNLTLTNAVELLRWPTTNEPQRYFRGRSQ